MRVGATSNGTSKYRAVQQELLERIATMHAGDRLPSETALCAEFGVSRITLRHAVDRLVQEGRLQREHGRGTFVTEPPHVVHYPERFTEAITGFHRQQSAAGHLVTTQVLRQELATADGQVADRLGMGMGDRVVELVRLRFVNGQLHQHVITALPYERFPETLTADFSSGSLYNFLAARYDVALRRNDLVVSLEPAAPEVAVNLSIESGVPLLAVASTVYDTNDVPVAHGVARHTPEHSEISLSLHTADAPMSALTEGLS